jgi:hypothetical protein
MVRCDGPGFNLADKSGDAGGMRQEMKTEMGQGMKVEGLQKRMGGRKRPMKR